MAPNSTTCNPWVHCSTRGIYVLLIVCTLLAIEGLWACLAMNDSYQDNSVRMFLGVSSSTILYCLILLLVPQLRKRRVQDTASRLSDECSLHWSALRFLRIFAMMWLATAIALLIDTSRSNGHIPGEDKEGRKKLWIRGAFQTFLAILELAGMGFIIREGSKSSTAPWGEEWTRTRTRSCDEAQ